MQLRCPRSNNLNRQRSRQRTNTRQQTAVVQTSSHSLADIAVAGGAVIAGLLATALISNNIPQNTRTNKTNYASGRVRGNQDFVDSVLSYNNRRWLGQGQIPAALSGNTQLASLSTIVEGTSSFQQGVSNGFAPSRRNYSRKHPTFTNQALQIENLSESTNVEEEHSFSLTQLITGGFFGLASIIGFIKGL